MKPAPPARIHLLPAKASPYVIVIRRKPTDWFHVLRWNTETDQLEHGSWLKGMLYAKRSDVSFDGNWMVFLTRDFGNYKAWNRVSHPPILEPIVNVDSGSTWYGGGYWTSESILCLNGWHWPFFRDLKSKVKLALPFAIEEYSDKFEDRGVLYHRITRDGWSRAGDNWGTETRVESKGYIIECIGDNGWKCQPTPNHPTLRMAYIGYKGGLQFKFWLEEFPGLIKPKTDWACWDCLGQLIFSCEGILYKFGLNDIRCNTAKTVINLEHLSPP